MEEYVPLTNTRLMGYCNELMCEINCSFIESIFAFIDDFEGIYDVYDVVEVLTSMDKDIIVDYFKGKYNILSDVVVEEIVF